MKSKQTALIEIELVSRDVHIPVNYAHVEALQLVDVVERDAAYRRDVLVRIVDVIEHFTGDQDSRENEPITKKTSVNINTCQQYFIMFV